MTRVRAPVSVGTRRECLDHPVVLREYRFRRVLTKYVAYFHRWWVYLSLALDARDQRPVQLPDQGAVVEVPKVRVSNKVHV